MWLKKSEKRWWFWIRSLQTAPYWPKGGHRYYSVWAFTLPHFIKPNTSIFTHLLINQTQFQNLFPTLSLSRFCWVSLFFLSTCIIFWQIYYPEKIEIVIISCKIVEKMRRILKTTDSSLSPSLCRFLLVKAYPKRYSSKIPSDLVLFLGLGFIDW